MSNFISPRNFGITAKVAFYVRKKIFNHFMSDCSPSINTKILDIGVTSDKSYDSNFFEKLYPYSSQITAIGLEDASFLEEDYPGLKFINCNAKKMPFGDNEFDYGFCSAVIEHVGSRSEQKHLIEEISRVCKKFILTTPNKYFPVELHTFTFFIHWLPSRYFRAYLRILGSTFFSKENNLNLLSEHCFERLLDKTGVKYSKSHIRFFGMTSNLVFYCEKREKP